MEVHAEDELDKRFEIDATSDAVESGHWTVLHEGRHVRFPQIAHALRKRAERLGIFRHSEKTASSERRSRNRCAISL